MAGNQRVMKIPSVKPRKGFLEIIECKALPKATTAPVRAIAYLTSARAIASSKSGVPFQTSWV